MWYDVTKNILLNSIFFQISASIHMILDFSSMTYLLILSTYIGYTVGSALIIHRYVMNTK